MYDKIEVNIDNEHFTFQNVGPTSYLVSTILYAPPSDDDQFVIKIRGYYGSKTSSWSNQYTCTLPSVRSKKPAIPFNVGFEEIIDDVAKYNEQDKYDILGLPQWQHQWNIMEHFIRVRFGLQADQDEFNISYDNGNSTITITTDNQMTLPNDPRSYWLDIGEARYQIDSMDFDSNTNKLTITVAEDLRTVNPERINIISDYNVDTLSHIIKVFEKTVPNYPNQDVRQHREILQYLDEDWKEIKYFEIPYIQESPSRQQSKVLEKSIGGLTSSNVYKLVIYAHNENGNSPIYESPEFTLTGLDRIKPEISANLSFHNLYINVNNYEDIVGSSQDFLYFKGWITNGSSIISQFSFSGQNYRHAFLNLLPSGVYTVNVAAVYYSGVSATSSADINFNDGIGYEEMESIKMLGSEFAKQDSDTTQHAVSKLVNKSITAVNEKYPITKQINGGGTLTISTKKSNPVIQFVKKGGPSSIDDITVNYYAGTFELTNNDETSGNYIELLIWITEGD